MKQVVCPNCGADEFVERGGYRVCVYCDSKFVMTKEELPKSEVGISFEDDIALLLQKCKYDPLNARRYANLILDLDPFNKEARRYL